MGGAMHAGQVLGLFLALSGALNAGFAVGILARLAAATRAQAVLTALGAVGTVMTIYFIAVSAYH